jgi:putative oxidoreductase
MAHPSSSRSTGLYDPNASSHDAVKLLLRVVLGVLILLHGISKIKGGPGFVLELMRKDGLPEVFGYFVYVGEVLAPVLIIVGLWTRAAAIVIAINMIVALLLVHTGQLLSLSPQGGWALELQAMYLTAAIAVAMLGAGRFSIGGVTGRCN